MLTCPSVAHKMDFRPDFQPPFWDQHTEVQPIDAPECICAGSTVWVDYTYVTGGSDFPSHVIRGEK